MLPTLGLFSQGGSDLGREQTPVPQLSLEEKAPSRLTIVRRDREEKKKDHLQTPNRWQELKTV